MIQQVKIVRGAISALSPLLRLIFTNSSLHKVGLWAWFHIGIWSHSGVNFFRYKEKGKTKIQRQNKTWQNTLKSISLKSCTMHVAFWMASYSSSEGLWKLSKVYACCFCILCNSLRDFLMWQFKRKYPSSYKRFPHFPTVLLFLGNTQQYMKLHINSCSCTG